MFILHNNGSSTPNDVTQTGDVVTLGQYYVLKDILFVTGFVVGFTFFVIYDPNYLNHSDNYILANPMQTPPHIVPE